VASGQIQHSPRRAEMRCIAYGKLPMDRQDEPQGIVHVVDDDDGVRDSMRFLLESEGLSVRAYDCAQALLDTDLPPHGCVLTDFRMPGLDGLQLQARLSERGVALPVVVMTAFAEVPAAVRAMKAGAMDFLEKPCDPDTVLNAIRRSLDHNRRTLAAHAAATGAARRIAGLTPREREVMDLLAAGNSTKEIARVLGASPRTIDVHRARVFQKLQVDSLPDLVHLALAAEQGTP
jgi:two-component system response regulator FixJ